MRSPLIVSLLTCSVFALPGCDLPGEEDDSGGQQGTDDGDPETSGDTGGEEDDGSESDGGSDSGDSGQVDDTGEPPDGPLVWQQAGGPCGGSITNAMWFDDRETGFIGCGENAAGEGLFTTIDGGLTWEDNVRFNEVRIMDIRRGPDGVLYGAGIHQLDGYPVWAFDESGANIDAQGLYTASNSAFLAVNQAENAAVTADGQMLIDSLTGTTAAYRPAGGEFEELDSLSEDLLSDPDALSFQVRRIRAFDNQFFAVGSLINDPARVHLPSQLEGATYHFHSVLLQPDNRDGELHDMHVWDAQHMIVAGYDQSTQFPLIYLVDGGDPYDSEGWEQIELLDSGIEWQGDINGLSVQGDTVIAVGEKVPTAQGGFVVRSDDAGKSWEDITPTEELGKIGPLSRVWLFEDGEMVAAGGGGEMLIYAAE